MILIKVIDGVVVEFPYTIEKLRNDNPSVSFPAVPSENILAAYNAYKVELQQYPEFDDRLYLLSKPDTPALINGVWTMEYTLIPRTDEEIQAFDLNALTALREKVCSAIDDKTNELITYGFVYNGNIKVRLTLEDQQNFEGEYNLIKDFLEQDIPETTLFPLNFKVWTNTDGTPIFFTSHNLSEMRSFIAAGKIHIKTSLNSGWEQKEAVSKLTLDQLKVWKDPRITE